MAYNMTQMSQLSNGNGSFLKRKLDFYDSYTVDDATPAKLQNFDNGVCDENSSNVSIPESNGDTRLQDQDSSSLPNLDIFNNGNEDEEGGEDNEDDSSDDDDSDSSSSDDSSGSDSDDEADEEEDEEEPADQFVVKVEVAKEEDEMPESELPSASISSAKPDKRRLSNPSDRTLRPKPKPGFTWPKKRVPFALNTKLPLKRLENKLRAAEKRVKAKNAKISIPGNGAKSQKVAPIRIKLNTSSDVKEEPMILKIEKEDPDSINSNSGFSNLLMAKEDRDLAIVNLQKELLAQMPDRVSSVSKVIAAMKNTMQLPLDAMKLLGSMKCMDDDPLVVRALPKNQGPALWSMIAATSKDTDKIQKLFLDCNEQVATALNDTDVSPPGDAPFIPPNPLNELEMTAVIEMAINFVVKTSVPKVSKRAFDMCREATTAIRRAAMEDERIAQQTVATAAAQAKNIFLAEDRSRAKTQEQARAALAAKVKNTSTKISTPDSLKIEKTHKCTRCTYQTFNRSHLRRHESTVHNGEKIYFCYICKVDFARSEKCKAHFQKEHPELEYDPLCVRKDRPNTETRLPGVKYESDSARSSVSPSPSNKSMVSILKSNMLNRDSPTSSSGAFTRIDNEDVESIVSNTDESVNGSLMLDESIASESNPSTPKPSPQKSRGQVLRCTQCSYLCKDIWHMKRHIQDRHSKLKEFKCKSCDYSTSRKDRIVAHMTGHGILHCMYCEYTDQDLTSFNAHLRVCSSVAKTLRLTCEVCQQTFYNRKILQDHMQKYHNMELFYCDFCPYASLKFEDFEKHFETHFTEEYVCKTCNLNFTSRKAHSDHVTYVHDGVEENPASTPGKALPAKKVETPKKSKPTPKETKPKKENILPSTSKSRQSTTIVKESPAEVNTEPEVKEEKKADLPQDWLKSIVTNLTKPQKENPILPPVEGGLEGHGSGKFFCPYCPNRAPWKYKRPYDKHLASHALGKQKREFPCIICGQTFTTQSRLSEHLLLAHNTRCDELENRNTENQCPYCPEKFVTPSSLTDHMMLAHVAKTLGPSESATSLSTYAQTPDDSLSSSTDFRQPPSGLSTQESSLLGAGNANNQIDQGMLNPVFPGPSFTGLLPDPMALDSGWGEMPKIQDRSKLGAVSSNEDSDDDSD